jgi:phosphate starvation-inducible PhoH-like protein
MFRWYELSQAEHGPGHREARAERKEFGYEMSTKVLEVSFEAPANIQTLYGPGDENLRRVEKELGVELFVRGETVRIRGEATSVDLAYHLLEELYQILQKGFSIYPTDVDCAARMLKRHPGAEIKDVFLDVVYLSPTKRRITPKSIGQKQYIDAIRGHDLVFGIGPAGTGKTFLAMAMAVSALMRREVMRIVLARPAVEAGEKLGFLPGSLYEKVNPYLRPLYDALHDMMDYERASRMVETGEIEVAPLAFMRGRTLNDSFVILDEAQNSTSEQMKMFLTRLGLHSRAVITGDITQIDLPPDKVSGLVQVQEILKGLKGVGFQYFTEEDVVRHRLVQDIIGAYEKADRSKAKDKGPGSN